MREFLLSEPNSDDATKNYSHDLLKRKYDTIFKFFFEVKIMTVNELYIYELTKFCLKSLKQRHSNFCLNSMFSLKSFAYNTRNSKYRCFVPPFCNNEKSCSLTNRGSELLNILAEINLLPEKIGLITRNEDCP